MPIYNITYNATIDENIKFILEAENPDLAQQMAETISYDILTGTGFINENIEISCVDISLAEPEYVPLTPPSPVSNSGYTPVSSLRPLNQSNSSNYNRLT
tara:strand:- start:533 stop:832 length:300 start_codon:yes stop_codon:yes gene_type:complete